MKTIVQGQVTHEALHQAVGRLDRAVQLLDQRIKGKAGVAGPTERSALRDRIERWTDEIRAIAQQVQHAEVPIGLTEDPRAYRETIDPHATVSPDALRRADARMDEALERGRSHRDQVRREIGPVLSASEVAHRLGVSRVTVNNWRRQNRLLALQWDSHQYRYPAFQFADNPAEGEDGVVAGLAEVLRALTATTNWGKVRFFLDPTRFPDRRTPLDILRQGDPCSVRTVLEMARAEVSLGA